MMFYDYFEKLCKERDITPAQVRKELGISQSTMASWKSRGLTPNAATLVQLADYFEITVDALLGKVSGTDSIKLSDEILYLLRLLDMPDASLISNQIPFLLACFEIFEKAKGEVNETNLTEIQSAVFACYTIASTLKSRNFGEDIYTLRRKYSEITHDVKHILDSFQHLNTMGKREAIKRIKELTYVPQYQRQTER